MKRTLFILALSALSLSSAHAAVGDVVTGNGIYIADGVVVSNIGSGYLQTSRTQSSRLYDSTKGAEWAVSSNGQKQDSNMCYLHASSNAIQYWQSYYGVFAKSQAGYYYDYDASFNTGFAEYSVQKPLPYGRIGTESPSSSDSSTALVPDGKRLAVARDLYLSIPNSNAQPRNLGGYFSWASEWFFRGADKWPDNGSFIDLSAGGMISNTGGYYANYFGDGAHFVEDLSYTTVFSVYRENLSDTENSTTGAPFDNADANAVKDLLLQGFGVKDGVQSQSGLITCISTNNSSSGNGHMITCYGFTTNEDGTLKSILIVDNNDDINKFNSEVKELFVRVQNERIELYKDPSLSKAYTPSGSGVNFITAVSFINTPEVLQNMLAEYSDVSNEAQVWNGGSSVWNVQLGSTEELPTESTGWDVHVDGDNITAEHRGYYHTYSTEGRNVLFGDHAAVGNRTVTINGTVSAGHIEVAAEGYRFEKGKDGAIAPGADMTVRSGASLDSEVALALGDLELEQGALLSSSETITVKGAFLTSLQKSASFSLRNAVTPSVSVDADLDLREATSITLNTAVDMKGHDLFLSADTPITISLSDVDGSILFFENIGTLSVLTTDGIEVITEGMDLTQYFSITSTDGADLSGYSLVYADGALSMSIVPEPTTATLSLLALAALTMRRRRK